MITRNLDLYLKDIADSIQLIIQYADGLTLDKFEEDIEKQDSIIRRLEIIGEAVKQLPEAFIKQHQEIPWRDIGDFRNVLVHEYFGLKTERIWIVIQKDLPKLKKQMDDLLTR